MRIDISCLRVRTQTPHEKVYKLPTVRILGARNFWIVRLRFRNYDSVGTLSYVVILEGFACNPYCILIPPFSYHVGISVLCLTLRVPTPEGVRCMQSRKPIEGILFRLLKTPSNGNGGLSRQLLAFLCLSDGSTIFQRKTTSKRSTLAWIHEKTTSSCTGWSGSPLKSSPPRPRLCAFTTRIGFCSSFPRYVSLRFYSIGFSLMLQNVPFRTVLIVSSTCSLSFDSLARIALSIPRNSFVSPSSRSSAFVR